MVIIFLSLLYLTYYPSNSHSFLAPLFIILFSNGHHLFEFIIINLLPSKETRQLFRDPTNGLSNLMDKNILNGL